MTMHDSKFRKVKAIFGKRKIVPVLVLVFACVSIVTLTVSWLDRTVDDTSGAGFAYSNTGRIMGKTYKLETYYYGMDRNWHLITTDFQRYDESDESTIDWSTTWDKDSGILIPGSKTLFKTVITNYMPYDMTASLYLGDVSVNPELKEQVFFGASSPQVNLYSPEDTHYFVQQEEGSDYSARVLPICEQEILAAGETLTVEWYVNTSSEVVGGMFPVLQDKATHIPISDGKGHYYYVNKTDEDGNPTEAFLCSASGVVVFDSSQDDYTEYDGEYEDTETGRRSYGEINDKVTISGMYAAIG